MSVAELSTKLYNNMRPFQIGSMDIFQLLKAFLFPFVVVFLSLFPFGAVAHGPSATRANTFCFLNSLSLNNITKRNRFDILLANVYHRPAHLLLCLNSQIQLASLTLEQQQSTSTRNDHQCLKIHPRALPAVHTITASTPTRT